MTRQNSPYRLDKDKVIIPENDSVLAVIPLSARNIILSACEYFNWRVFWSVNPPTDQEWDNIQFILAELEQSMTTAISVQSLDDRLQEIKTAIEGIDGASGEVDCSCFEALIPIIAGGSFPPLEPTDWDDPANADLWDYPTQPTEGATDHSIAACRLAKRLIESLADTLDQLAPVVNLGASGAAIAAALLLLAVPVVGWATGLSLVTAASIWSGLMSIGSSRLRETAAQLRADADTIACEFELDILDSKADIRAFLSSFRSKLPQAARIIAATMYGENFVNELAQTNVNSWPGSDCECEPEVIPAEKVWDFGATGLSGWSWLNSAIPTLVWSTYGSPTVGVRTTDRPTAYGWSRPFTVASGQTNWRFQLMSRGFNGARTYYGIEKRESGNWILVAESGSQTPGDETVYINIFNNLELIPGEAYRIRIRHRTAQGNAVEVRIRKIRFTHPP